MIGVAWGKGMLFEQLKYRGFNSMAKWTLTVWSWVCRYGWNAGHKAPQL